MGLTCWIRGHVADPCRMLFAKGWLWSYCRRCDARMIRHYEGWAKPDAAELAELEGHLEADQHRGRSDDDGVEVRRTIGSRGNRRH